MAERSPIERSEMGGGDPAGFAGGAGGKAPRGIVNRPRRFAALAALAVGLAVLVVVDHGELAGWIAGDRDATGLGDEPVAFYTCPMDPSVESDHPGPCPICGMALTPVSREDRTSGVVRV